MDNLELWYRANIKQTTLSEQPPLTFKANGEPLKNYCIYGNTVNGESVGNRTGNLFDGEWENKYIAANGFIGYSTNRVLSSQIHVVAGQTYTVTAIFLIRAVHSYNGTVHTQALFDEVSGAGEVTFTIPDGSDSIQICLKKANDRNFTPDDVEWCMLNEGSTAIPYEPYGYKIPIICGGKTTNIYIGDDQLEEGESVSYAETGVEIPTNQGTNTLTVNTTVQPSMVSVTTPGAVPEGLRKYLQCKYDVQRCAAN